MKHLKSIFTMILVLVSLIALSQKKGEMPITSSSKEVPQMLRNALDYYYNANIAEGNKLIKEAIEKDSDCALAHVLLFGDNETYKKNIERAENMKMSADEKLLISGLKANLYGEKNNNAFDPLIKKYPKDAHIVLLMAFNIKDDNKAIEVLNSLAKKNKKFAPVFNILGYRYMALGEMDKARESFDKYIAMKPDLANVYDSKGDWFMANGQMKEAQEHFEKAAKMGMKASKNKAKIAKIRLANPDLNKKEIEKIKTTITNRKDALTKNDIDMFLVDHHDQVVEIYRSLISSVGISNLRTRFKTPIENGSFSNYSIKINKVIGLGNVSVVIGVADFTYTSNGKDSDISNGVIFFLDKINEVDWKISLAHYFDKGEWSEENNKAIAQVLNKWGSLLPLGEPMNEKTVEKFAELYSPQAVEIFGNNRSNIGLPNLKKRWSFFNGSKFENMQMQSIDITGSGDKAIVSGVVIQSYYPPDSEELTSWNAPFVSLMTKENGEWKFLALHWK